MSTWGHAWQGRCVSAGCVVGRHVWLGGVMRGKEMCMYSGGMQGKGGGVACMASDVHGRKCQLGSGWYASCWNAVLVLLNSSSLTFLTITTVLISDVNVRNVSAISFQMLSLYLDISLRDSDIEQQFRRGKYKSANSSSSSSSQSHREWYRTRGPWNSYCVLEVRRALWTNYHQYFHAGCQHLKSQ